MEASTALMSLFVPQINQYGIMDEEAEDDGQLGTPSSSSSSCCDSGSSNGSSSSSSELADDATSKLDQISSQGGPYEMASLMAELPFKRGLSRHFQGKSQSFTSLASVRCLEDLVKPERPHCRKKLKSCRSYAAGLESQRPRSSPTLINGCSKAISKRPAGSRGGAAAVVVKRSHGFLGGGGGGGGARPPVAPPHRSGSFSAQTTRLLFA